MFNPTGPYENTMTDETKTGKNKALHQLMEDEFQQLVDIIEQKKIIHEDIELQPADDDDPILGATAKLRGQSEELGAESLAEFFYILEDDARNGNLAGATELLQNISDEFESVKKILEQD